MIRKLAFVLFFIFAIIPLIRGQEGGLEQAADIGKSQSLESIARTNFILKAETKQKLATKQSKSKPLFLKKSRKYLANKSFKKPKQQNKYNSKKKLQKQYKLGKKRKFKSDKTKKELKKLRKKWQWSWFKSWRIGRLIDLDWFMVAIVIIIPAVLLALLVGPVLSFLEMFFLVIGFGFAVFSYFFLVSEANVRIATYQFFVKYGLFAWVGVLAIIAGFAALFGATGGSLLTYILIGAILGIISFIVSLIVGDSILNGF